MAKRFSHPPLKSLWFALKRGRAKGFTLLELLVSIIIGGIITLLLLSLVVQLTQSNQDDAARSQVQQDMQTAMDYITQDLREAVFVYNGQCLQGTAAPATQDDVGTRCPGVVNHIPTFMSDNGRVPVLAFWRTKPLPQEIRNICSTNVNQLETLPGVPCVAATGYSLVVYALDPWDSNEQIWKGNARLIRYELSQFPENPANQNDLIAGFVDPLNEPSYSFQQWPYGKVGTTGFGNRQTARPNNPAFTLVDFVDDKGSINETGTKLDPNCEEFAPFPGGNPATPKDPNDIRNALSPTGDNNTPRGFYACVRNGGIGNAVGNGANQDVLLTLVGNVSGKPGFVRQLDNQKQSRLSPLQTRVLVRGIIKKVSGS